MINRHFTDNDDGNRVLDLSVKKTLSGLLSPPSSTTSSSSSSSSLKTTTTTTTTTGKRLLDVNLTTTKKVQSTTKRPLRFQCKYCDYKAPSTSLMQNHIYRHTDLTPYACVYCGHKSTTKSTIMVHIELCHPNMEVKILENRVREQDFYRDLNNSDVNTQEPQTKKLRRTAPLENELTPINGVAIHLKTLIEDGTECSPEDDEISEVDHFEPIIIPTIEDESITMNSNPRSPSLKLKISPAPSPNTTIKESESEDDSEYLLVYNRPKQYYGSLYEPDKQYACQICSYTTNHRPSMEDHVYVHTSEKPYKCGYCGEEILTRYAATYHIKYKHPGMSRNFIQNKADITQYYINRAKKDEEKNQFKIVDTRRVKVRARPTNQQNKFDISIERPCQQEPPTPPPPLPPPVKSTNPTTTTTPPPPDYRFLLAWSYYLATQSAWLSPLLQQQQQQQQHGQSLPTDPEAAAKFLQAMQTVMASSSSSSKDISNENEES